MKKIIFFVVAFAFVLSTPSCTDFLVEDNRTGETADLTYSTKTGIDGLVGSCYSFARGWYGKEAGLGLSEMGTDLFYYGYDNKQKSLLSYNITAESLDGNTADNASLDHYWELFYSAVDVCNNALKYVPLNKILTDTQKKQYLAEAYFMRAFYHLHMVNIWGPIVLNTEAVTKIDYNPVRQSEEVVYSKILEDLDMSVTLFNEANYKIKTEGRASYWAAKALKARTLLYAASWLGATSITTNTAYAGKNLYQLAKTESADVIASNYAQFYTNYADTWSMNNEDVSKNKESIFGITYSSDIATQANCIPKRYKTNASGDPLDYNSLITRTGYTRGGSAMLLMFVSMWNNGSTDIGTDIFVRVLGATTSTVKHTVTGVNVDVAAMYSPYGRGFTRYLPSVYLWKLLEQNRATDQRTEATLLSAYKIPAGLAGSSKKYTAMTDTAIYYSPLDGNSAQGIALQAWAKNKYRLQFLSGGDVPVMTSSDPMVAKPTEAAVATSAVYGDNRYNSYKIGGWCSYPGIKKFLDNVYDPLYPTHDISKRDAMVIRLAEMYLIKAEAELGLSAPADALTTINALRDVRAIPGQNNRIAGPVTLNTILDERAIELCGEQQRWFDLKRTRTLVDRVKAYNAQGAANVKATHLLRPIPQSQFDAIANKTEFLQNEGYN